MSSQERKAESTRQKTSLSVAGDAMSLKGNSTPTPWTGYTDGIGDTATIAVQRDGLRSIIATCYRGNLCDEHGGSHEDNAALIVKAVNSYEAMREALKGAQNDINFHGGKLSGGTIDAIKKALTLAEGKEPS